MTRRLFEHGAVVLDGSVVKRPGRKRNLEKEFPDEYVDAKGGVIMPAFITHIFTVPLVRGLSIDGYDPHGFLDILDGMWWTIDRHSTLRKAQNTAPTPMYLDSD